MESFLGKVGNNRDLLNLKLKLQVLLAEGNGA